MELKTGKKMPEWRRRPKTQQNRRAEMCSSATASSTTVYGTQEDRGAKGKELAKRTRKSSPPSRKLGGLNGL